MRIETGAHVEFHVEATSPRAKPLAITFLVDGAPQASGATFVFAPAAPGTYLVSAIVSDGQLETACAWTVTVEAPPNVPPTAVLSVEPGGGEAPLVARFRVQGADPDGSVTRFRLEVVGPAAFVVEHAAPIDTLLLLEAGSWQATAIVEDERGASAVATRPIEVTPPNRPPVPILVVDPVSGVAPLDVRVEAGGSDPDGEVARYRLDLDGDGAFEVESAAPLVRTARFPHPVTTWIRLAVTDDRGAEGRDSVRVQVTASEPPPGNAAPAATLVVSPAEGDAPLDVEALVAGTDSDGVVRAVRVDFDGDGETDASAQAATLAAAFRYELPGTYLVRATVEDDDGASGAAVATVVVRASQNAAPIGALDLGATSGDAPLEVRATASGSDPDGRIVKWEIEANEGDGFLELDASLTATLVYAFDENAYRPRLRLTDDSGATTIVEGAPVTVYRPIAGGSASATGNPHFASTLIAPAVWSDGEDEWRFAVSVHDPGGDPLPDVPIRVGHTRGALFAPDGVALGPEVVLTAGNLRTGSDGTAGGTLTTVLSTRIERAPVIAFQAFALVFEADAGHGQWREVARVDGLNANSMVSASSSQVLVFPANQAVCPGTPIEIEVLARRGPEAPSPGSADAGRYTELRYTDGSYLGAAPRPGYDDWRTDGAGVIRFGYTPTRADQSRLVHAWVDGQPLQQLGLIALKPVSECGS
ncbi:MAG TPA: PKD domain-containing protein [Gemmatimonadota bacterium]